MTGIRVVVIIIAFFSCSAAFGQIVSVSQLACNPNSLNSGASTTASAALLTGITLFDTKSVSDSKSVIQTHAGVIR